MPNVSIEKARELSREGVTVKATIVDAHGDPKQADVQVGRYKVYWLPNWPRNLKLGADGHSVREYAEVEAIY